MHKVVVMDEGNSAAEDGIEAGVSYVEQNDLGNVTTKQMLTFEDNTSYRKPFQATEKCISNYFFFFIS